MVITSYTLKDSGKVVLKHPSLMWAMNSVRSAFKMGVKGQVLVLVNNGKYEAYHTGPKDDLKFKLRRV